METYPLFNPVVAVIVLLFVEQRNDSTCALIGSSGKEAHVYVVYVVFVYITYLFSFFSISKSKFVSSTDQFKVAIFFLCVPSQDGL